ncbi:MAG: hypothetical protein AAF456_24040 [Planctomycetota bacterium]
MRFAITFCVLLVAAGCSPAEESAAEPGTRLSFDATQTTSAVTQDDEEGSERSVPEFVESYNRRFLTQPPALGSELPDLTVFAEDGSEFEVSATRGRYTVLVFGCLT